MTSRVKKLKISRLPLNLAAKAWAEIDCVSLFGCCGPAPGICLSIMIENKISGKLPGLPILVEGKVDRIEKKKDGNKKFLIDYKSSKITGPQNELQSSQILIYSWLLGAKNINISEAGYLCIDNKESKWLKIEKIDRGEEIIKKLCSTLLSLKEGYPIQPIASKSGFICKSCSMRPVCRKDEWISVKKD